jgi:NAD(P)-dependent dehydrogenase (short-subunit alcohol dehydrogenase family)
MSKLERKVVITGGNSGIGLATAQRFVAEGSYISVTGCRQSELVAAVKQIGKDVTAVQGDVSNLADLDRLSATCKEAEGAPRHSFRQCRHWRICSARLGHRRALRQNVQRQRSGRIHWRHESLREYTIWKEAVPSARGSDVGRC